MAFAAIVLNVHICSISNKIKEFDVFTTKKFFEVMGFDDYIPKNAEKVYIYHHAYGRPFDPCVNPYHFCTLFLVEDGTSHNVEWYDRNASSVARNEANEKYER